MLYALLETEKIKAEKGLNAICPICKNRVVPKVGEINKAHWAHINKENLMCPMSKRETDWHLGWKNYVSRERCEVAFKKGTDLKIADVVLKNGKVVEFQHSPISPAEIRLREDFYKNMIWVFDIQKSWNSNRFFIIDRGGYFTFRWKNPKKSIAFCTKPVYLDLGDYFFRLKKIYPDSPCGGWGILKEKEEFINWMVEN